MFVCDTGGTLNRVLHFYHYDNFDQRDAARRTAAKTPAWSSDFLPKSRQYVSHQESTIFLPAAAVLDAAGSVPIREAAAGNGAWSREEGAAPALYELRQYALHPGYGSVPKLIEAFQKG